MTTLINKIERAIGLIRAGFATQYISCENENGDAVTIRIANHSVNPERVDDEDISIVVDGTELENSIEEGGYNFCISKKNFKAFANEYHVDIDGSFTENFRDMEELLIWHEIKL